MDLRPTEEQERIRAAAREFFEAKAPAARAPSEAGDARSCHDEVWREMADLGWMGTAISERYGGVGAGFLELCLVIEELGRAQLSSPFVPTTVFAGLPIARFGSAEQKRDRLPAIARGERVMSYTGASFGSGWNPQDTGVCASACNRGYVLDGEAPFVPCAQEADELLVVARARDEQARELAVFLVDAQVAGISCEPLETIGAERQDRVRFDGVRVSERHRLGAEGGAVAAAIGEWGAAAACAEMIGGGERVLEMTVAYAADRHQFGRPIGSFQAVQHHCANMAVDVLCSRWIGYEAIWRLSEGLEASEHVSMAKAWVSDAYRRVCALAHQVHGAIGFTKEYELHRFYRHAQVRALSFGDSAWHRERVAQEIGL